MDIPKPHPPKSLEQKFARKFAELPENKVTTEAPKKPAFVRKPHLTDRPFRDLKTQLDTK